MGFLYIIKSKALIKIGITADIRRRMNELKPDKIYQVVKLSGERELERELHRRFADKRLQGSEYFFLSQAERRRACRLARRAGESVKFPYQATRQAKTYWWLWWVSSGRVALLGIFGSGMAVGVAAVIIPSQLNLQPRQVPASFAVPTKSFVSV